MFNLLMDEIIIHVRTDVTKMICNAANAVIITDNEDDLLLYSFYTKLKGFSMHVSITKTKILLVSIELVRCKTKIE